MYTETFHLELITPCFCGGAEPDKHAEIRVPSIRGQLRWWFRTLGGFKSFAPQGKSLREQEAYVFGITAADKGQAGHLLLRLNSPQPASERANADDLGAVMTTPLGYALFPLRPTATNDGKRGMIAEGTQFRIEILWRGDPELWHSVRALIAVWAHLGGLGFRSRRAFGALCMLSPCIPLEEALNHFATPDKVVIHELQVSGLAGWRQVAEHLLEWYRSWRQHGQMHRRWDKKHNCWINIPTQQQMESRKQPGFKFARRDHNEGLDVQGTGAPNPDPENPHGSPGVTFRPALGLPIIQYFSSLGNQHGPLPRTRATVNWDWGWSPQKEKGEGRFASPILLRPYRDAAGTWHALVIFVDAHAWPEGKEVHLSCDKRHETRRVSLELYHAMKTDPRLKPFP